MNTSLEVIYYLLLAQVFKKRSRGEDDSEILDRMDSIWYQLDPQAIARINSMSARIANGEMSEADFVRLSERISGGGFYFYIPLTAGERMRSYRGPVDRASSTLQAGWVEPALPR